MTKPVKDIEKILKEVRRVQWMARKNSSDLLSGEYASAFKGRGMEFENVREYVPGDDIRAIDWNVTARSDGPFIKTFQEERETTVIVAIDVSASVAFGSTERSKLDLAAEVAAVLMLTALKNNDKVGLLLFADHVVRFVPPRKVRGGILRLIREILTTEPVAAQTDIAHALQFLGRVQHRRAVLFLISDFISHDFERSLAIANRRHDCIAVSIRDPLEGQLPDVGWILVEDIESGGRIPLDSSSRRVREWYQAKSAMRETQLAETLRKAKVDHLSLRTDQPYGPELQRFFLSREKGRAGC